MTIWKPELEAIEGPIYKAIADSIQAAVNSGKLKAEEKLPTHRSLADHLQVTTGTITRAYAEAERRGLVYAVIGRGTFVRGNESTDNFSAANDMRFLESTESGLIDLHINMPLKQDRASMLTDAMTRMAAEPAYLNQLLDYQPDIGVLYHRQVICDWIANEYWCPAPEQLVITNGGQHAILISLMTLTRPGDTVLAEALSYPGFTAITRQLNLQVRAVAMDEQGITGEALEAACKQNAPRVLFCTPTIQNPTTATMSLERRKTILEICARYQVMVIEDEVSVALATECPPPLAALDSERVVHVGSFSKTIAAGVRVGYCVAPQSLQMRLGAAVRASCWMVSPVMVAVVCEWLKNGSAKQLLEAQRREIVIRTRMALDKLKDFQIASVDGGLHIWLNLPEPWHADEFVEAARKKGVLILGATTFSISRTHTYHAVRISLSAVANQQKMEEGIDILVTLLKEELPEQEFTVF